MKARPMAEVAGPLIRKPVDIIQFVSRTIVLCHKSLLVADAVEEGLLCPSTT